MNIIEKLGITKAPWKCVEWSVGKSMDYYHTCYKGALGYKPLEERHGDSMMRYIKEDAQLIASAPEMLEALIFLMNHCESEWPSTFKNITRDTIQKATGKSWEQIKALI